MKEWDFEVGIFFSKPKKLKYQTLFLCLMAIIGFFQCDPGCLPTQKWLKNTTNDISIQEFHNIITH